MKRITWVVAFALLLTCAPLAMAGDYHTDATLLCAQCHIMHFSQSHGYQPNGSGFFLAPDPGGPFTFLLRAEVNDLCLSCHDAGPAPDVLGSANNGTGASDIRLAGYLNRLGLEGLPATGHTLDSLDEAPGSDPPWKPEDENGAGKGLNCVNCHHQHAYAGGANAYRNLRHSPGNGAPFPGVQVTYNDDQIGTFDVTKDVFERNAASYDESDVDWMEPDPTQSKIGQWCGTCHDNFHGTPGDAATVGGEATGTDWEHFLRHPTAGVQLGNLGGGHSSLGQYNANTNKVKVMSEVGTWDPAGSDVTPTCISCHKAHGNGNAFGLIYRSGSGTLTENGDTNGSQLEHLCGQCHVQASFFASP
jgi:hypothetical protein